MYCLPKIYKADKSVRAVVSAINSATYLKVLVQEYLAIKENDKILVFFGRCSIFPNIPIPLTWNK